jgi:hypothetical protein
MRFSPILIAGALLVAPWQAPAQDAAPAGEAGEEPAAAPEPAAETKRFVQDKACMTDVTPELEAFFGEPVAWPEEGHTVHTPGGLTVLGQPVSYVLVKRSGSDGRIDEVGYRLQGLQRRVGQPHDAGLLKAFDSEFEAAKCVGSTLSSCGVMYRPNGSAFAGAQIGSGEIDVSRDARGPSLALIEADYDLLDADPVFLVCFYRES